MSELPHNHQKGKQCRSCRLLKKLAREERDKEIVGKSLDAGKEILKEAILATGYTAGQGLNAIGQWSRGVGGNPDPVSQGISIGAGALVLLWAVNSFPNFAKFTHLDSLKFIIPGGGVPTDLPPEDSAGRFCVRIKTIGGVESHKCWLTTGDRDKARTTLATESFGLYSVTDYDQPSGTPLFCLRADGFNNARIDQCFTNSDDRQRFIDIGLATKRIANPQLYETTVEGSHAPISGPPPDITPSGGPSVHGR